MGPSCGCRVGVQIAQILEVAADHAVPKGLPLYRREAHDDLGAEGIAKPEKTVRAADFQTGVSIADCALAPEGGDVC